MPHDLAVVVVSYGSSELLARHLVGVHQQLPDARVVVVDNLTTGTERRTVEDLAQRNGWELVSPEANRGFGGGVNLGVARALALGCRDLLVLNPDAWLDAAAVAELRARLAEDRLCLLAPVIRRPDGRPWSVGSELVLRDGSMRRCPGLRAEAGARAWLSGAVLLVSAELWARVGGFDERYFLYWEDVDLCHRVLAAGGRLAVVETALAVHDEGGTQEAAGSRAKSAGYYYFNIRNRLLYASLHLDRSGRRRWRRSSWSAAREVLLRGGRRQFLRPLVPLGAAFRGVRDGRRLLRDADPPRR